MKTRMMQQFLTKLWDFKYRRAGALSILMLAFLVTTGTAQQVSKSPDCGNPPDGSQQTQTRDRVCMPVINPINVAGSAYPYPLTINVAVKVDAPEGTSVTKVYIDGETPNGQSVYYELNDTGTNGDDAAGDSIYGGTLQVLVGTPGLAKFRAVAQFSDGNTLASRLGGLEVFDPKLPFQFQPSSSPQVCSDDKDAICSQVTMLFAPGADAANVQQAAATVGTLVGLVNLPFLNTWQVNVDCKDTTCVQNVLNALKSQAGPVPGLLGAEAERLSAPLEPDDGVFNSKTLSMLPQGDLVYGPDKKPNDPQYPLQWGPPKVKLPAAWDKNTGGDPKTAPIIAIVDTGIDRVFNAGADFQNVLDRGIFGLPRSIDFTGGGNPFSDTVLHGTNVAGVAAATGDNKTQIAGASWSARLVSVRIIPFPAGRAPNITAAQGLVWSVLAGASITNASWGFGGAISAQDSQNNRFESMAASVAFINWTGRLLVATAGNNGGRGRTPFRRYPAAFTNNEGFNGRFYDATALAIGATDINDNRADFSSWGTWVQLYAPGSCIISTAAAGQAARADFAAFGLRCLAIFGDPVPPPNTVNFTAGTSFAAPLTAGIASLLRSQYPKAGLSNIMQAIIRTADNTGNKDPGGTTIYRINAEKAIAQAP